MTTLVNDPTRRYARLLLAATLGERFVEVVRERFRLLQTLQDLTAICAILVLAFYPDSALHLQWPCLLLHARLRLRPYLKPQSLRVAFDLVSATWACNLLPWRTYFLLSALACVSFLLPLILRTTNSSASSSSTFLQKQTLGMLDVCFWGVAAFLVTRPLLQWLFDVSPSVIVELALCILVVVGLYFFERLLDDQVLPPTLSAPLKRQYNSGRKLRVEARTEMETESAQAEGKGNEKDTEEKKSEQSHESYLQTLVKTFVPDATNAAAESVLRVFPFSIVRGWLCDLSFFLFSQLLWLQFSLGVATATSGSENLVLLLSLALLLCLGWLPGSLWSLHCHLIAGMGKTAQDFTSQISRHQSEPCCKEVIAVVAPVLPDPLGPEYFRPKASCFLRNYRYPDLRRQRPAGPLFVLDKEEAAGREEMRSVASKDRLIALLTSAIGGEKVVMEIVDSYCFEYPALLKVREFMHIDIQDPYAPMSTTFAKPFHCCYEAVDQDGTTLSHYACGSLENIVLMRSWFRKSGVQFYSIITPEMICVARRFLKIYTYPAFALLRDDRGEYEASLFVECAENVRDSRNWREFKEPRQTTMGPGVPRYVPAWRQQVQGQGQDQGQEQGQGIGPPLHPVIPDPTYPAAAMNLRSIANMRQQRKQQQLQTQTDEQFETDSLELDLEFRNTGDADGKSEQTGLEAATTLTSAATEDPEEKELRGDPSPRQLTAEQDEELAAAFTALEESHPDPSKPFPAGAWKLLKKSYSNHDTS